MNPVKTLIEILLAVAVMFAGPVLWAVPKLELAGSVRAEQLSREFETGAEAVGSISRTIYEDYAKRLEECYGGYEYRITYTCTVCEPVYVPTGEGSTVFSGYYREYPSVMNDREILSHIYGDEEGFYPVSAGNYHIEAVKRR